MPRYYIAVLARGLGLLDRFTRYDARGLPSDHHSPGWKYTLPHQTPWSCPVYGCGWGGFLTLFFCPRGYSHTFFRIHNHIAARILRRIDKGPPPSYLPYSSTNHRAAPEWQSVHKVTSRHDPCYAPATMPTSIKPDEHSDITIQSLTMRTPL